MQKNTNAMSYKKLIILFIIMIFTTMSLFVYIGLDLEVQNILSSLYLVISTFLSAMMTLPIMGIINRIKKRNYFYKWTNVLFWVSIVFFILFLGVYTFQAFLEN